MRLILDTHTFLWFVTDDPQLSAAARVLIVDPTNEIVVSPASYWEVAIKVSLGKYPMTVPFEQFFTQGIEGNDFAILPIQIRHAAVLSALPMHHKDPFDRMIIAQARASQRPLLIVIDQQPKWLAHIEPVSDTGQPVAASLLQKYTLCHVDATTAYGKAVAKVFRTSTFPTTVIIDKTGSVQLVRKTGRLHAASLASMLTAHQRGERPVVAPQPTPCRT
jgi:PIN domain nuclease of toxin-antitoxin system